MSGFPYSRTCRLGRLHSLTFSVDGAHAQGRAARLRCEWSPDVPTAKATCKLLPAYREAGNNFHDSLALDASGGEL